MHMIMRSLVAFAAVGAAQGVLAQMYPNPAGSGPAVQIAQARQANAALMHQYTWQSRTEIMVNGQIKDIRIQQNNYGPYGALQSVSLNDQPSGGTYLPTPIGFLRRAIADNEKQQMEQYLTGLKGLLEQYTLPGTGKIYQFMSTAVPAGPDAYGNFTLTGYNVVQPGDSLSITVNGYTRHPRQLQVNTTFQGDAVQLSATFATVPVSGLNYAAFAEATVPAKNLSVQVQNYNYARLGY
jgi:hypothetical protein